MKTIKLTEREKDFLISAIEYFEESDLKNDYTSTRKGYKFTKKEMAILHIKLNTHLDEQGVCNSFSLSH